MITDKTARALSILRDACVTATEFAERMWPDSPGWKRVSNLGAHGASAGACMPYAAGGYLGRLRKRGLVEHDPTHGLYMIARAGTTALDEYVASLEDWIVASRSNLFDDLTTHGTKDDFLEACALARTVFIMFPSRQVLVYHNCPLWGERRPLYRIGLTDLELRRRSS